MHILRTVWVAKREVDGQELYFHERGYGTFTYDILYAMMCHSPECFNYFLEKAGVPLDSIVYEKLNICKPITEEIS